MNSVMISIKPEWCKLIETGEKKIDVRKTKPKCEAPFKCYIYCTKGKPLWLTMNSNVLCDEAYNRILDDLPTLLNGKVIGEFICNGIDVICPDNFVVREDAERALEGSCVSVDEFKKYMEYVHGAPLYMLKDAYAWHISDLVIYDKPKELCEFKPLNRQCYYSDLGYAKPKCNNCNECKVTRPPQSWMYVEVEE